MPQVYLIFRIRQLNLNNIGHVNHLKRYLIKWRYGNIVIFEVVVIIFKLQTIYLTLNLAEKLIEAEGKGMFVL